MSQIPQVNATLTRITGEGTTEDYNAVAGVGNVKWHGASGCYVRDHIQGIYNPVRGTMDRWNVTSLYIDDQLPLKSSIMAGDSVTYDLDGVTITRKVMSQDSANLPGATAYNKLTLENVNAS